MREKGLTARNFYFDGGSGTVKVELRNWAGRPDEPTVRRAIVTAKVDPDTGKTVFDHRLELVGRGIKKLTSELSTDGATRTYFAEYTKSGLVLVIQ